MRLEKFIIINVFFSCRCFVKESVKEKGEKRQTRPEESQSSYLTEGCRNLSEICIN